MSLVKLAHVLTAGLCFAAYPAHASPIVSCIGVCGLAFGTTYSLNGNAVELRDSGDLGDAGDLIGSQTVNVSVSLYTGGPARPGLATLVLYIAADGCCGGGFSGTASADGYSLNGCFNGAVCRFNKTVPFTLGEGFDVILNGNASTGPSGICGCVGSESYMESADVSLFELNGQPVTISEAPEPPHMAMVGLLAFGILGFVKSRSL